MRRSARSAFGTIMLVACLTMSGMVDASDAAERDPFEFGTGDRKPAAGGRVLVGVIHDASSALAVVGDQMLRVGDELEGWRVLSIDKDSMTVERDGRQHVLSPGSLFP